MVHMFGPRTTRNTQTDTRLKSEFISGICFALQTHLVLISQVRSNPLFFGGGGVHFLSCELCMPTVQQGHLLCVTSWSHLYNGLSLVVFIFLIRIWSDPILESGVQIEVIHLSDIWVLSLTCIA